MKPKYDVGRKGTFPIGGWSWWKLGPDGYPSEPVFSRKSYLFRCLAVRAAEKATGG